eukprot:6478005-Amphidinium_carterae.1
MCIRDRARLVQIQRERFPAPAPQPRQEEETAPTAVQMDTETSQQTAATEKAATPSTAAEFLNEAEQPERLQTTTSPHPVQAPVPIAEMQTTRQKIMKLVPANFNCADEGLTTRQLQEAIRTMYFKYQPTIDYYTLRRTLSTTSVLGQTILPLECTELTETEIDRTRGTDLPVPEYMEMKATFQLRLQQPYGLRDEFKTNHCIDHRIITTG